MNEKHNWLNNCTNIISHEFWKVDYHWQYKLILYKISAKIGTLNFKHAENGIKKWSFAKRLFPKNSREIWWIYRTWLVSYHFKCNDCCCFSSLWRGRLWKICLYVSWNRFWYRLQRRDGRFNSWNGKWNWKYPGILVKTDKWYATYFCVWSWNC